MNHQIFAPCCAHLRIGRKGDLRFWASVHAGLTEDAAPKIEPERIPPLHNGDRLTAEEFERRYEAMPDLKKAELINGVVYMPPPVTMDDHGAPHFDVISWLGLYRMATPYKGFTEDVFVDFPHGTSSQALAEQLARAGVLRSRWDFAMCGYARRLLYMEHHDQFGGRGSIGYDHRASRLRKPDSIGSDCRRIA